MTQEEKQILLKDLCSRLPYGVRVKISDEDILLYDSEKGTLDGKETMSDDNFVIKCDRDSWIISCDDFKPYLRPMSSMTEEEKKESGELYKKNTGMWDDLDWLNAHYFDYRGLIDKGLAIAVTEENNPY